jgi:hypothetical protein
MQRGGKLLVPGVRTSHCRCGWPTRGVRGGCVGENAYSHFDPGRSVFGTPGGPYAERPTGRGTVGDSDIPQGRRITEPDALPKPQPWEPRPLNEEQSRNNPYVIPAAMASRLLSCAT